MRVHASGVCVHTCALVAGVGCLGGCVVVETLNTEVGALCFSLQLHLYGSTFFNRLQMQTVAISRTRPPL